MIHYNFKINRFYSLIEILKELVNHKIEFESITDYQHACYVNMSGEAADIQKFLKKNRYTFGI